MKGRMGDFEYNYATVIFLNKPDATAACEALNGAALLGSEALMVRYATNTRADDMSGRRRRRRRRRRQRHARV